MATNDPMSTESGRAAMQAYSDKALGAPAPLELTFETMSHIVRQCKRLDLASSCTYLKDLKRQIELLQQR